MKIEIALKFEASGKRAVNLENRYFRSDQKKIKKKKHH